MKYTPLFCLFLYINLAVNSQNTELLTINHLSIYQMQSNPDTIIAQLENLQEVYPEITDSLSVLIYDWLITDSIQLQHGILYKLGLIRYRNNDFYRAIRLNQMAWNKTIELKDTIKSISYGNWLAYMLIHDNKYEESLKILYQCIDWAEKTNSELFLERIHLILGFNYRDQGMPEKALESFKKSLSYSNTDSCNNDSHSSLNEIGNIYTLLKNYDSAYHYHLRALHIRQKNNDPQQLTYSYNDMANAFLQKGDKLKALFYLQKALDLNIKTNQKWTEARIRTSLSMLFIDMSNFPEAEKNLLLSEKISIQIGAINNLPSIYQTFASLETKRGDYINANKYLLKTLLFKDSVLNLERIKNLADIESRYELQRKEDQIKLLQQQKTIDQKALLNKTLEGRAYALTTILIAIATFFIYRNYRIKRKANKILLIKNEEIENQRDKLELLNHELFSQKEEISIQKDKIEIQHDIINKKNNKITDSIVYARYIQKAVLPTEMKLSGTFRSYFLIYQPKDIISGDFYWLKHSETNLTLVVGDCTGHGVPGALMSMLGIAFLNDLLSREKNIKPNSIIERIRNQLKFALQQKGEISEISDGIDLAICSINPIQKTMEFSGANFSLFCNRKGTISEIAGDSQPAGISMDEKPFTNHSLKIEKDDIYYLFTDGYQSQFGGQKYEPIRKKRMLAFLNEICQLPLDQQKDKLESYFDEWKNNNEQTDDVLILAFNPF